MAEVSLRDEQFLEDVETGKAMMGGMGEDEWAEDIHGMVKNRTCKDTLIDILKVSGKYNSCSLRHLYFFLSEEE